jgi:hypothetical protein
MFVKSLNDPRIKYSDYQSPTYSSSKERSCTGGARGHNLNFNLVRGVYIAELDQDDFWAPDFLATKIDFLEHNPNIDFVHSTCAFSSGMVVYGAQYRGSPSHNTIGHLTVVYKSFLKKYSFLESGEFPADFARWQAMYKDGVKMQYMPVMKSLYNQKDKSFDDLRKIYFNLFKYNLSTL